MPIVILETRGADSSVLTEAVPETQAAIAVRPLGTAGELCWRGHLACEVRQREATPQKMSTSRERPDAV